MSVKAMTWVFENSPYSLGTRLVHLAIADIANEDNDWQVWVSHSKIAAKAKVSRATVVSALAKMVADGFMEIIESHRGAAATYRFLRPDLSDPDTPTCRESDITCQIQAVEPVKSADSRLSLNSKKTKVLAASPPRPTDDPIKAQAHSLATLAFEQVPKPDIANTRGDPFLAVMGLFERRLRSGVPVNLLRDVIRAGIEVWTLPGIQTSEAKFRAARHERQADTTARKTPTVEERLLGELAGAEKSGDVELAHELRERLEAYA